MALRADEALGHIRHALGGGDPAEEISTMRLLNDAGRYLTSMHAWNWLVRPPTFVGVRGNKTFTGGTCGINPQQIDDLEFAGYSFLFGDQIEITSGTNATPGMYRVISFASTTGPTTNIVKVEGTPFVDAQTNIAGELHLDSCRLPPDFGDIVTIESTQSLVNSIQLTSLDHLNLMRTNQIQVAGWNYYGAIVWGKSDISTAIDGGIPTARLEVWPSQTVDDHDAFTMIYRAKWEDVSSDDDFLSIPPFMELMYLQILRALATGYEEDTLASVTQRLAEVRVGPEFEACRNFDQRTQETLGPLRGGAVARHSSDTFLRTSVPGPT